ncbi:hypothetical protein HRI_001473700 [Hibiscus trionum]|uniref:CCHC-type domain-containing protein n=1 Tax=Hibiscus trionum TaxID=183268 RepID=A0A9W7HI91_HIBTR|nr:hypothetical protein HRI_001473700 [Hibiscus trionum]
MTGRGRGRGRGRTAVDMSDVNHPEHSPQHQEDPQYVQAEEQPEVHTSCQPTDHLGQQTQSEGPRAAGNSETTGVDVAAVHLELLEYLRQGFRRPISAEFLSVGMSMFDGKTAADPADAEYWLKKLQQLFEEMDYRTDRKLRADVSLLKGEAQNWWEAEKTVISASRVTWDYFRQAFRDIYVGAEYLAKCREDFMNLKQNDMTVNQYEIEFLRLIQYVPGLVTTEKEKCDWFLRGLRPSINTGVALHLEKEYKDITLRARTAERNEAELRQVESQGMDRGKRQSTASVQYSQGNQTRKRARDEGDYQSYSRARPVTTAVSTSSIGGSTSTRGVPQCSFYKKWHFGECRRQSGACFRCGSFDHLFRDCPLAPPSAHTTSQSQASVQTPARGRGRGRPDSTVSAGRGRPAQSGGSAGSGMRQPGLVYATRRHEDRDEPDVIAGTFSIHSISYFALLDIGSTHSYVASSVSGGLEIPVENTVNAVSVYSPVGDHVKVTKVYKNFPLEI